MVENIPKSAKNEPIEIDDIGYCSSVIKYHLGDDIFIFDSDYYESGKIFHYLGCLITRCISMGNSKTEIEIPVAPVGSVKMTPSEKNRKYIVDLPTEEELNKAITSRLEFEERFSSAILFDIKEMADNREEMHFSQVSKKDFYEDEKSIDEMDLSTTEAFELGRDVGMYKMANLIVRSISNRMKGNLYGRRRWNSPEYSVIRERRSDLITDLH